MKKTVWIFVLVLVAAAALGFAFAGAKDETSMMQMEYRTDIEPLVDRFGEIIDIQAAFWKADVIGSIGLGPTSYWLKGFIFASDETLSRILTNYPLKEADIQFEEGMSPDITGLGDFEWGYNDTLSREICGGFVGKVYIDTNNGVFYFDMESN